MNLGMNPGVSLDGERVELSRVALEVFTTTGQYVTKATNLEIQLIGSGAPGGNNTAGGNAGATAIKRIIGLPIGTILTVTNTAGSLTCAIPGYANLVAAAGIDGSRSPALSQGGDLNIPGGLGLALDQDGAGGYGGASTLGVGGAPGSTPGPGVGFGAGGGCGINTAGGAGQPGVMVVRYF